MKGDKMEQAAPPQELKNAPFSVASLVLGILGLFFGLLAILALIFGILAKNKIKESPGMYKGGGMALAGIILGAIGIAGWLIWMLVWLI